MDLNKKYEIINKDSISSISLKDLFSKSEKTILYFYPKDNTPWCSLEAKDFSHMKNNFRENWVQIIWVSKDSLNSHKKFIEDLDLSILLISDPQLTIHKELWAYWEKNNYGKKVMWVIRSTFIFDRNWNLLKSYKNVRAKWHVERVLKEI